MHYRDKTSSKNKWQLHQQQHKSHRAAWLRASVLGADDGIVSVASIMLGVAAAQTSRGAILTAGIAGLIAGALSMAAGEYVSVSSQRDAEQADLRLEADALEHFKKEELGELEQIYIARGLEPALAREVAKQLHKHDALAAHARDELGIDHEALANPLQAATSSALSFSLGAMLPIIAAVILSGQAALVAVVLVALGSLFILGIVGAVIGGGNKVRAALRVLVGGGLAMAVTALIGKLVGTAV